MPAIEEEIRDSFEAIWPKCDEWTEVAVAEKFTQLVGRVSSRMFGGKQLSQNSEWVNTTITFAVDGFTAAQKLKKYPRILRPLVAKFIPEINKIKHHYKFARNLLIPIMQERKRTGEKPMDLLQWMMDNAKGPEETDEAFIADIMLKVSFAAIHTSAAAPTQLIYDLCQMPEIVAPLREEMEAALLETNGHFTKQAFNKMPKMDSFLKESQRFNPLLLITFERLIHAPLTLSPPSLPPLTIPANTTIGVPTQVLSMDPSIYPSPSPSPHTSPDPSTHTTPHPPPHEFHPFRFALLRSQTPNPQEAGRWQYAASNPQSMHFGYGRHACPGRGFASLEIKAILGMMVGGWDFRGVGDVEGGGGEGEGGDGDKGGDGKGKGKGMGWKRPESVGVETQLLPDQGGRVMMKRRRQV
ncbi:hypothetical protein Q9189_006627 [Teloschistes chrysophthalmus]